MEFWSKKHHLDGFKPPTVCDRVNGCLAGMEGVSLVALGHPETFGEIHGDNIGFEISSFHQ